MAKNISPQEAAARHADAGLRLSERYRSGATGKGQAWATRAAASENNFKDGISRALSAGSYGKGVGAAGPAAYDEGVRIKGAPNWSGGMQASNAKYLRKIQPFSRLWNEQLSVPRGAKRSQANLQRMQLNAERFQKASGK